MTRRLEHRAEMSSAVPKKTICILSITVYQVKPSVSNHTNLSPSVQKHHAKKHQPLCRTSTSAKKHQPLRRTSTFAKKHQPYVGHQPLPSLDQPKGSDSSWGPTDHLRSSLITVLPPPKNGSPKVRPKRSSG